MSCRSFTGLLGRCPSVTVQLLRLALGEGQRLTVRGRLLKVSSIRRQLGSCLGRRVRTGRSDRFVLSVGLGSLTACLNAAPRAVSHGLGILRHRKLVERSTHGVRVLARFWSSILRWHLYGHLGGNKGRGSGNLWCAGLVCSGQLALRG